MEQREKLLLHVPHSSTSFPRESHFTFNDLDDDERLLIDYFTDELFIPKVTSAKIGYAVFPYCRLYCDVERLMNDPLEADGLGFSYSRKVPTADGLSESVRSFGTKEEAFEYIRSIREIVEKEQSDSKEEIKELIELIEKAIIENKEPPKGFFTALRNITSGITDLIPLVGKLKALFIK